MSQQRTSDRIGTDPIGKLLANQAIPAAFGFMIMSLNMVVDRYYIGQYINELGIGAISVDMPILFLIASYGMSVGMGGASIVSRSLGSKKPERVQLAFNNQISLTLIGLFFLSSITFLFKTEVLKLWGAIGDIMPYADTYLTISLIGVPFLGLAMMANNNLRAEGKANMAMMVLFVPSIINVILDDVFIRKLGMKMEGAAWATTISYVVTGIGLFLYYLSGRSELKIQPSLFALRKNIVKEIFSVGSVSIIRQGSISLLMILLNQSLYDYGVSSGLGGERAIAIYGIASGIAMFAFFPLIGIAQGFVPIAGFNYGAENYDRVKSVITLSLIWGGLIASLLCFLLLFYSDEIPRLFTRDEQTLSEAPKAIFYIFMATPVVVFQLIGASYYQALGKGLPALLLTLTKQAFFLIPLVILFPIIWGIYGIWYAFTAADLLSGAVCAYFLFRGAKKLTLTRSTL